MATAVARVPAVRVQAVVLDWAGTTVDHGSRAPIAALARAFRARGIELEEAAARGPMGMAKRAHIATLLADPVIAERWRSSTGSEPDEAAGDALYEEFQSAQIEEIARHADLIPGAREAIATLRAAGIAIGSTTGYFKAAALAAADAAAAAGYAPDVIVTPDDVPAGRPEPWMLLRAMEAMRIFPPSVVVKVGDTAVDMAEGRNAGTWAIGVSETGNEIGLDAADLAALPPRERRSREAAAADRLYRAGAHLVIPSVAVLPAGVAAIDARLAAGEHP